MELVLLNLMKSLNQLVPKTISLSASFLEPFVIPESSKDILASALLAKIGKQVRMECECESLNGILQIDFN